MNKDIKVLIIGFGSIGQRHYKNLTALGYKNVWVYDSDKKKVKSIKLKVKSLDVVTLAGFDVAFICNPNNKHVETAIKCANAGLHLFIEKPLSHNLKNIQKLQSVVKKKKLVAFVACNMRFHPPFKSIKEFISSGELGRIYSINHEFGQFLPFWRPGTDYRKNYAAKKSMGGGIILDDIHEFDLLFWLNDFSPVKKHFLVKENTNTLKIETEDQAKAIFQFKNGVLGSVSCDYLSQEYHRRIFITGEKGNVEWVWKDERVIFSQKRSGGKTIYQKKGENINQMYIDEVKYFLDCVNKKRKTFNDIDRAKNLLNYLI